MESVIVGRNVRTWSVKFGSSRTKLVPLGMGMCLNSQMLELIKLDFLFYSVRIILPVGLCRIGSSIPILSLIQILYQKMKGGIICLWSFGENVPQRSWLGKRWYVEEPAVKTVDKKGSFKRSTGWMKSLHNWTWHWWEFNQNTIIVERAYLCDKLLAFLAGGTC